MPGRPRCVQSESDGQYRFLDQSPILRPGLRLYNPPTMKTDMFRSDLEARRMKRLDVTCSNCFRRGSYVVARLNPDVRLADMLSRITADCPKRTSV
jgi:hypothetical protein